MSFTVIAACTTLVLGTTSESAVPTSRQHLVERIPRCTGRTGTEPGTAVLVERLRAKPSILVLRDIAELRERGRDAGGAIVELLASEDWEVRVGAARALGYIQYTPATTSLLPLLADATDWRRVFVSAESLGRLRAEVALGPLERVAEKHWYPPVRAAALTAIKVIRGEAAYAEQEHFPFEFFGYVSVASDNPAPLSPQLVKEPDALSASALERLKYSAEIVSFGVEGEHVERVEQKPDCGLRVSNGYLLGADRGEWGGEVIHLQDGAPQKKLLDLNTSGLHRLGERIIAVTGVAHLISNEGMLYQVTPRGASFMAKPWRALPGAPLRSGLLADGRLFVSCVGGDIVITPEGNIELANPRDLPAAPAQAPTP